MHRRFLLFFVVIFAFALFPVGVFASTNTDGLVGYWKLDETSGTEASDSSGHGNSGTLNGDPSISTSVPTTDFTNARSLDFDGSGDYVDMGDESVLEVEGSLPFTISVWFKPNTSPGAESTYVLAAKGTPSVRGYAFQYEQISGNYVINISKYGVADQRVTISELGTDTWYHLVGVQRSGEVEYYIDGVSQGTVTNASSYTSSGADAFRVGAASNDTLYVNGLIDEVRVYNRELSSTEITALSNGNHTSATWDGSSSADWETAANWDINAVPDNYTNITIANTSNDPVLGANVGVHDLTINSSSSLDLSSYDLTVNDSGTFTNNGTLRLEGGNTLTGFTNDTDSGAVMYDGTSNQTGLAAGDSYNDLIVNDGLIGYWKLDEGSADSCSGSEDVCDASGYGNHGTWNGSGGGDNTSPTWVSGTADDINFTNPYGMSFDGTDDYIVSNDNSTLTGNATFSVALWFYVPSGATTTGNYGRFVDWGTAAAGQSAQIGVYNNTIDQIFVGHWATGQTSSTTFTNDAWHHAVWVRTGGSDGWSGNQLYIDGSEVTLDVDVGSNHTPNVTADPYDIGGRGSGSLYVENRLDDVRVYSRTLTADEISALANGNQPATSTATYTLDAALDVNGDFQLSAGTLDVSGSNYGLTVGGDWNNYGGVFNERSGTVTLDGTSQNIPASETFYNFSKSVSSADTLTLGAKSTMTVSNSLTFQGAASNLLTLASSVSGTAWNLTAPSTQTISYVSVSDSNASSGTEVGATDGTSTDGGNNTNWNFSSSSSGSETSSSSDGGGDGGGLPELTDPVDNYKEKGAAKDSDPFKVAPGEVFELKVKAVDADQVKNVTLRVAGQAYELVLDDSDPQNPVFTGEISISSAGTYEYRVVVDYGWTVRRKQGVVVVEEETQTQVIEPSPTTAVPAQIPLYSSRLSSTVGPVFFPLTGQEQAGDDEPDSSEQPDQMNEVLQEDTVLREETPTPTVAPEPERKSFMVTISGLLDSVRSVSGRVMGSMIALGEQFGTVLTSAGQGVADSAQYLTVRVGTLFTSTSDEPRHIYDKVTIKLASAAGEPLAGANVTMYSDPKTGTTDKEGVVEFAGVESGEHELEIYYDGYTSKQDVVLDQPVAEVTIHITAEFNKSSGFLWF